MTAAPFFVQHCSPPAVLLRVASVRRDLAPRADRNAKVAFTAHSTAAAPPELRHGGGAARTPQAVPRTAASGVRLYEVAVPLADDPGKDDFSVHEALCKASASRLGCKAAQLDPAGIAIVRKSFDARKEKVFKYVVDVQDSALSQARCRRPRFKAGQVERLPQQAQQPAQDTAASSNGSPRTHSAAGKVDPVVVIGAGPAGLFAALAAAEAGLPVVLLERGQPVEIRGRDIGALMVRRQLNPESNLCYGEGGAGTWSDGKLATRIGRNTDPVRHVLQVLHELGAPDSVLVAGKPHLGTDRLVRILRAFRRRLQSLGVNIRFGTRAERLLTRGDRCCGVQLCDGERIAASRVVVAPGHSSRALLTQLQDAGVKLVPKPFALGFRVEHPQSFIDSVQYGERDAGQVQRGRGRIPVADYRLAASVRSAATVSPALASWGEAPDSVRSAEQLDGACMATAPEERSVFSFCMCPGGQIVPTSTSEDELCVNGMSFSRRDSKWANSALVVAVGSSDWDPWSASHGPLAGVQLQVEAEREAARRGGGAFVAPVQRVSDFMARRTSSGELPSSSYRLGVRSAPLHDLYSSAITDALHAALLRFDRQMPGFIDNDGLLHGVETRTSSPCSIERGEDLQSTSLRGLYPAGEGAGYAGGIVSAAVDGWKVGQQIVQEITAA